jgi:hypothetical protein
MLVFFAKNGFVGERAMEMSFFSDISLPQASRLDPISAAMSIIDAVLFVIDKKEELNLLPCTVLVQPWEMIAEPGAADVQISRKPTSKDRLSGIEGQ